VASLKTWHGAKKSTRESGPKDTFSRSDAVLQKRLLESGNINAEYDLLQLSSSTPTRVYCGSRSQTPMKKCRALAIIITAYASTAGLIWGTIEAYTYFEGEELKQLLGNWWPLLFVVVPALVAIITGLRMRKNGTEEATLVDFQGDQGVVSSTSQLEQAP
jgi:hypothetical protein